MKCCPQSFAKCRVSNSELYSCGFLWRLQSWKEENTVRLLQRLHIFSPDTMYTFQPLLFGWFYGTKTASGYSCYNNMEHVRLIALMSPLAVIKAWALTFSGYCIVSSTWFIFLLTSYLLACLLAHSLTHTTQHIPSSEANRFSASQISRIFMESEGSWSHSQKPATCPYPEPEQSSLRLLIQRLQGLF